MTTDQQHQFFFVHHQVTDMMGWNAKFTDMIKQLQDLDSHDAWNVPMWKGNKCALTLTAQDSSAAFCVWQCPASMTGSDFQAFIDEFMPYAVNTTSPIVSTLGGENLNFDSYIEDIHKIFQQGHVLPYCGDGNLWFVRHHVLDKAKWDALFAHKFGTAIQGGAGDNTTMTSDELSKKWHVPHGVMCVFTAVLSDSEGSFCMWNVPRDYNRQDFKDMIDNFTGGISKNSPVWPVDLATGLNVHLLHPDFFTHSTVDFSKTMMGEAHRQHPAETKPAGMTAQYHVHAT